MAFKGYFIDDTEDESIYATLMSTTGEGGLTIEYRPVSDAVSLAGELFDSKPDIIMLDFRLDGNPDMIAPKLAYQGSGLAQLLRDKASVQPDDDFPIILMSAEDKFERYYRPDSTAHDLFDRTYGKVSASENASQVRLELLSLCSGYKILKSVWSEGYDRLSIFGLETKEREIVEAQELRTAIGMAAAPHIAARVILKDIIDRPGILLSSNEISARLGLTDLGELTEVLVDARLDYLGIFHGGWQRWWSHRFDNWAEALFGQRPTTLPGEKRRQIIEEKFGLKLNGAISTWNGSPHERFAFSCAACHKPGEVRHSVSAFDPATPRFSQRRRICWDCVQTGNFQQARLVVDDVDANIVEDVLRKERERYEGA